MPGMPPSRQPKPPPKGETVVLWLCGAAAFIALNHGSLVLLALSAITAMLLAVWMLLR